MGKSTGILEAPLTTVERFVSRIHRTDGCWEWIGGNNGKYGQFYVKTTRSAHRIMYELVTGIDLEASSKVIDHLCRNTLCVRPTHLELVTNRENVMRGENFVAALAHNDRCFRGHDYTEDNTGYYRRNGEIVGRRCRICLNTKMRAYRKTPQGREAHNRNAREYRANTKSPRLEGKLNG